MWRIGTVIVMIVPPFLSGGRAAAESWQVTVPFSELEFYVGASAMVMWVVLAAVRQGRTLRALQQVAGVEPTLPWRQFIVLATVAVAFASVLALFVSFAEDVGIPDRPVLLVTVGAGWLTISTCRTLFALLKRWSHHRTPDNSATDPAIDIFVTRPFEFGRKSSGDLSDPTSAIDVWKSEIAGSLFVLPMLALEELARTQIELGMKDEAARAVFVGLKHDVNNPGLLVLAARLSHDSRLRDLAVRAVISEFPSSPIHHREIESLKRAASDDSN